MTIEVLLFASYREAAGAREFRLELRAGARVRDAAARLEADYPELSLKGALAAIDEDYARPDSLLKEGATLAFFPPVSGGAEDDAEGEEDYLLVTGEPLDIGDLTLRVSAPSCGASALFVGTVRSPNAGSEVAYIDYEGYEGMILRQLARVAGEARARHELGRLALAHRLGRLEPGEASIIIAVSSRHRQDALLACRFCIDRCKDILPVWKCEVTDEGSRWVAGSSAAAETL
ncbi:MAG: molybdenum cofactor biosynthesis protein MoaE [Deinococcota bacterium]|jgi:molybdopterin synthase catalytic subunit|nr:molybdenum cofactor biosynthesis protein MoaE [Deinococcota bacterium]